MGVQWCCAQANIHITIITIMTASSQRHTEGEQQVRNLEIKGVSHGQQQLAAISSDRQSNMQQHQAASMCRPAGRTDRSAASLASKPSRDCLRLLVGEAMLRRRVLLLRDSCLPAASRLVRRLLLLDKPRC